MKTKVKGRILATMRHYSTTLICVLLLLLASSLFSHAQDRHTGTVEEALVGIEVSNAPAKGAAAVIRRGNGLVLRCDGFILAPSSLFAELKEANGDAAPQSIVVVLNPGTDREKRIAGVPRPHYIPPASPISSGFTVVKLANVHIPALKTRAVDIRQTDRIVHVYFSAQDSSGKFRPVASQSAETLETTAASTDLRSPGCLVRLKAAIAATPAGSVVVGADGMAVGLVTDLPDNQTASFLSFQDLNLVTNCVSPVPTGDDPFQKSEEAKLEKDRMLPVSGGSLTLPAALLKDQPDMNGEKTACLAPFHIDRYEVTNSEYLEFWLSLPEKDRSNPDTINRLFPRGWANQDDPFPAGIASYPVLGVTQEGAARYARFRGKRLPTPYEWVLAGFGPGGESATPEWVKRYLAERRTAWNAVSARHDSFAQHSDLLILDAYDPSVPGRRRETDTYLPWITQREVARRAAKFSQEAILAETPKLDTTWLQPNTIHKVGGRPYDVSPFGAFDMVLNGAELVVAAPPLSSTKQLRWYRADWVLDRTTRPWSPRISDALLPAPGGSYLGELTDRSLNRLIGRGYDESKRGGFILGHMTWMLSNLAEQVALIAPLAGMAVRGGSDLTLQTTFSQQILGTVNRHVLTGAVLWTYSLDGYVVWQAVPADFTKETGQTITLRSLDEVTPAATSNDFVRPAAATLTYLLPVGFRCAR